MLELQNTLSLRLTAVFHGTTAKKYASLGL